MNIELSPRHLQLRDMLFRRWKTNGVKVGDKIESQNEIVKFCEFSLITVIKTLKDLEAEGVIRRQVGKGSFLVKKPWTEAHHRIGFFYNRDIVGGGIFNNDFYTKLVVAFEKSIVSDGHEFILGSFTHQQHADPPLGRARRGGADRHHRRDRRRPAGRDIEPGRDHGPAARGPALPRLPHRFRTGVPAAVQAATTASGSKYLYLNSSITSSEQAVAPRRLQAGLRRAARRRRS